MKVTGFKHVNPGLAPLPGDTFLNKHGRPLVSQKETARLLKGEVIGGGSLCLLASQLGFPVIPSAQRKSKPEEISKEGQKEELNGYLIWPFRDCSSDRDPVFTS